MGMRIRGMIDTLVNAAGTVGAAHNQYADAVRVTRLRLADELTHDDLLADVRRLSDADKADMDAALNKAIPPQAPDGVDAVLALRRILRA